MKSLISLLFALTLVTSSSAQVFDTLFPASTLFYAITPTSDGNFVATGSKNIDSVFHKVWLVKFNPSGQVIWEKTYLPVGTNAHGYSVIQAADGGFVITGSYGDNVFADGGFVLKTAPQGSPIWSKEFSGAIYGAAQTADGQWLVGGTDGNTKAATIYRLTNAGAIIWQKNYPSDDYSGHAMRLLPQPDGGFFAAGRGKSIDFTGTFVLHAAGDGTLFWQKSWNNVNYDQELSPYELGSLGAVQAANGDILLADASNGNALLLRYTPEGEKIWEKYYGNQEEGISLFAMQQDALGNLYLAGRRTGTDFFNDRYEYYLLKTNAGGIEQWSRSYISPNFNVFTGIALRGDGTCLAVGQQRDYSPNHAYLVGFDAQGYRENRAIQINLHHDLEADCTLSPNDLPLAGWNVMLTGDSSKYVLTTDANGQIQQPVPDGIYQIEVQLPSPAWAVCAVPNVTIDENSGPVSAVKILAKSINDCPILQVSLTSPDLVRCNTAIYYVECQNIGTATATNAKVQVELDPWLTLEDASLPYVYADGKYEFDLGDLNPLARKRFSITTRLACNAELGQTHCVEARVTPVLTCSLSPGTNWSGASLRAEAKCTGSTVQFTLTNIGTGDMTLPSSYQIIADGWKRQSDEIQLHSGETWALDYPANGRSVWLEAEQVTGHPDGERPIVGYEGCGLTTNGLASTGFLDMLEHNGRDPQIAYACTENTRLFMPDRLVGVPEGYGWYHFIPLETRPEYVLRFHNPLPQVAQEVRVILHLSPMLDAATFAVVAASHDFEVNSKGDGVFEVLFPAAGLVSLSADSLLSRGFLRFRANMIAGIDTNVQILNEAQIYFDEAASTVPTFVYHYTAPPSEWLTNVPSPVSTQPNMQVFGGSSGFDFYEEVVENPDGSLFLLSTTFSYGTDYDFILTKTDVTGRAIWQKAYDFGGDDGFSHAVSDGAGGLIATGGQDDPAIPNNYLEDTYLVILRISAEGEVLWYRHEKPGTGDTGRGGVGTGIVRSTDGNFVITGYLTNGTTSTIDNFLLKITPDGQTLWFQNYLIAGVAFHPVGLEQTTDGGYIIGGYDSSSWPYGTRLQKVDAEGHTQWATTDPFSDETPNGMESFTQASDGGYTSLGSNHYYDADSNYVVWPVIAHYDAEGNFLWRKIIEVGIITYATDIISAPDGGYIIAGDVSSESSIAPTKILLAGVDDEANLLWWYGYDAHTYTNTTSLHRRANGQLLVTGQTQTSNYLYNLAGVLLLANADGTVSSASPPAANASSGLLIWPNPAGRQFQAHIAGRSVKGPFEWQLFDIQGRLIQTGQADQSTFKVEVLTKNIGIYQLAVQWKGGSATKLVHLQGY